MSTEYHGTKDCFKDKSFLDTTKDWKKENVEIVDSIYSEKKLTPAIFSASDDKCLVKMGMGDVNSDYACNYCRRFRRFLNLNKDITQNFNIKNNEYALNKERLSSLNLAVDTISQKQLRMCELCSGQNIENNTCNEAYTIYAGDNFTVSNIIHLGLQEAFVKLKIPHINTLNTNFICSGYGYRLNDKSIPLDDFFSDKLTPRICLSLIKQLVVIFTELEKFNFASLNLDLFDIDSKSGSYKYGKKIISGEAILRLKNFNGSAATFGDNHFHSSSSKLLWLNSYSSPVNRNEYTFDDSILILRDLGYPIYGGSLNFYVYLIHFMQHRNFFNSVTNDSDCMELWQKIWGKQSDIIVSKIETSSKNAFDMLKGVPLKSNILSSMINYV
jgi:hypothetical protein